MTHQWRVLFLFCLCGALCGLTSALANPRATQGSRANHDQPLHVPDRNPHPPETAADKARVALAELAVRRWLMPARKLPTHTAAATTPQQPFHSKDAACLHNDSCVFKDTLFLDEIRQIRSRYGRVTTMRLAHVIPWSMDWFRTHRDIPRSAQAMQGPQLAPDEYLVHIYARFGKKQWNHLDVILAEDAEGRVTVRHFFTTPFAANSQLPDGAVCSLHPIMRRSTLAMAFNDS